MPKFRKAPPVDRWIIVSTERCQRPSDVQLQHGTQHLQRCLFHPGQKALTPPEGLAFHSYQTAPSSPAWMLCVVPNTSPACDTIQHEARLAYRVVHEHDVAQRLVAGRLQWVLSLASWDLTPPHRRSGG